MASATSISSRAAHARRPRQPGAMFSAASIVDPAGEKNRSSARKSNACPREQELSPPRRRRASDRVHGLPGPMRATPRPRAWGGRRAALCLRAVPAVEFCRGWGAGGARCGLGKMRRSPP
jgi:hypothetical protein